MKNPNEKAVYSFFGCSDCHRANHSLGGHAPWMGFQIRKSLAKV
jgi:hypothetical protein